MRKYHCIILVADAPLLMSSLLERTGKRFLVISFRHALLQLRFGRLFLKWYKDCLALGQMKLLIIIMKAEESFSSLLLWSLTWLHTLIIIIMKAKNSLIYDKDYPWKHMERTCSVGDLGCVCASTCATENFGLRFGGFLCWEFKFRVSWSLEPSHVPLYWTFFLDFFCW